ncbi:biotin-dependent carboxyltransferase family protein [Terrarubrum flagellatum]|uniref:5-oxoprolinase subunit C family protein n=1 Tax=Terrirubrum flagellatum TaxID=2895980 RepID=UPI003144FE23
MSDLIVESCGASTTLQDAGRFRYRRYGVSTAGAMDLHALARANALVGNAHDTAAIEFCLMGGAFRIDGGSALIAVSGPGCIARIGAREIEPGMSARMEPDDRLTVGPVRDGVYAYLAITGGFLRARDMESLSVHRRSGIGGLPLVAGDRLPMADNPDQPLRRLPPETRHTPEPIRIVLGPQNDLFTPRAIETLTTQEFKISAQVDRMGCRLEGPEIEHADGFNIVSDGIVAGHIQVPGDRQPIVLLRDSQTTGGYPKIATVISADIGRFAQSPPGSAVKFRLVTRDEAVEAAKEMREKIDALATLARPVEDQSAKDMLFAANLIGGVANAFDFEPRWLD